jgi:hypothetical protein
MALTVAASGTLGTADHGIGTANTLATCTNSGVYTLEADLANMANGDITELYVYDKMLGTASASRIAYYAIFANVQAEPHKFSPPVPADVEFSAVIKQTAGTVRAFDWKILTL